MIEEKCLKSFKRNLKSAEFSTQLRSKYSTGFVFQFTSDLLCTKPNLSFLYKVIYNDVYNHMTT